MRTLAAYLLLTVIGLMFAYGLASLTGRAVADSLNRSAEIIADPASVR